MKVCVTGATGFVGHEVIRQLHAAGHQPRALVRRLDSHASQRLAGVFAVELHRGDVLDAAALEKAFSGAEAVIHLVGIISEVGQSTFENIHTRGTENVVRAATAAGARRFVHMSSLGTRPDAPSRYHTSKWAAEALVRGSGLDWTIFRPSVIYGPGDQFVNVLARMSRFSPVLPVMGSGTNKLQPIPVEAVAAAFVRALTEPRAVGQTYDLVGSEVFTFVELLDEILAVTGRRRFKLHLPMPLARALAAMLELICSRLLRRPPPLNREQLRMLEEDNVGDGTTAAELFALSVPSFRERIRTYL